MEKHLLKKIEGIFGYREDPIVILTPSKKIEFMNRKATTLFKRREFPSLHLNLTEQSEKLWPKFIENLKKNSTDTCIMTIQLPGNQYVTMHLRGYYIENKQLIVSRITIPTRMNNEVIDYYEPMNQMIQSMAQGVVLTSLSGQIITANDKALQYLECSLGEINNRNHDCLFIDMQQEGNQVLHYYRQLASYENATLEVSKVQRNGQLCYYRIESKIDFVLNLVVTTILDETEKMMLLNQAEHQDVLFLIGQNFASIVHELRNPLTSLTGFVQLIRDEMNQESQHFVQIMESELKRMDLMLADLLNLSKPKQSQFESFCFVELLEEVIDIMQAQAILSNTLLELEYKKIADHVIFGHRARVKQMVINLVKNAIEATPSRGKIILKLAVPQPGKCSLIVSDEGMGMTETTIGNLFKPYYTTKATGTGLGMMFVKKVVEEHNAEIMFCTAVGCGTQIKIDFKQQDNQFETYMKQRILSKPKSKLHCS